MIVKSLNSEVLLHKGWVTLIKSAGLEFGLNESHFISKLQEDNDISLEVIRDCMSDFYAEVKNHSFFYDIAKYVTPLTFSTFTLTLWTSPDVETLLKNMCAYSVLVGTPIRLNYHQNIQGNVELWVLDNEPINKENNLTFLGSALFISTMVVIIKFICANHNLSINIQVIEKNFTDTETKKYTQDLGVSVQTGHTLRKICIAKDCLHFKIPSYDKDIYYSSLNLLRKHVSSINKNDIILRIYSYLNSKENLFEITGNTLADELNMHIRTLNRKLSIYGTNCRSIIEKFKLEKALYLLENPNITMTEITYQLGFSDLSSFSRAFKRWTGSSPTNKIK